MLLTIITTVINHLHLHLKINKTSFGANNKSRWASMNSDNSMKSRWKASIANHNSNETASEHDNNNNDNNNSIITVQIVYHNDKSLSKRNHGQ